MILRAGPYEFAFPCKTLLMGVLNVTPDSFFAASRAFSTESAVHHALQLAEQGADILDVGGESTRPNATPVPESEELRRVLPVIEKLTSICKLPISIDTTKLNVAKAALSAGASMVNDIAAHRQEPELWETVAAAGAAYVCMHAQGTPQTMQKNPQYDNVVAEVNEFFDERLQTLARHGIPPERVVLDPGIGFAKSISHNLQLLHSLNSFTKWRCPLLLGVSRKSFLDKTS
ncbi:MAG TPA: dihydropteroate synthase, partial [Verrucomicrobiae bacterium]